MKKKQIIAMVIAAVLIIVIGLFGVGSNLVESLLFNSATSTESASGMYIFPNDDFIGVVNIVGEIQDLGEESYFSSTTGYNHTTCVQYLEDLTAAPNNRGLLLYIDSPGGYAYVGDDLYLELMEYKEETGRPIYAYFDSVAASAAYYAAMSADEIYANRMTTTGSIGVYSSALNLSGLYEKVGIKEYIFKSGDNKAMGSAGQEMTPEQIAIMQGQVDYMYEIFVDVVVAGRNMDRSKVYEIADGRAYTAQQALDLDMIDGICRYEEYEEMVLAKFPGEDIVFFYPDSGASAFGMLFGELKDAMPKSDTQALTEFIEKNENGGYYYESICY